MDEIDIVDDGTIVGETFFIDEKVHSVYDYLDGVGDVIAEIVTTGDFEIGANTLRSMSNIGHAIGISKAKLLHDMLEIWVASGRTEEDYYQYVIDFGHLSSRLIIGRYIDAWSAFLKAPTSLQDSFIMHPMKNLNALGAAISQGYEPDPDDWEKLAESTDNNQFLKTIREDVKKKPARKNSLVIYLEENGDLVAWQGDERCYLGNLIIPDNQPISEKAIERIVKGAGIIKR